MLIGIEASHANKIKRTGVEEVCFQLIKHFKTIIPSNVEVVLYSHKPLIQELRKLPHNWRVKTMKWYLPKGWSQFRLSAELLLNKPDIFFAPGQLLPIYCPKKTISIVHDSAFKVYPELYNSKAVKYLNVMNKLIARKSAKIITPSKFSKDEFLKYYNYKAENIVVIPWGYDEQMYNRDIGEDNNVLNKYCLDKPYFISIGRLEKKKNTISIIKAFNRFKTQTKKKHKLLLVGEKRIGGDEIEQLIQKSKYKEDIITPGWVGKEELPALLKKSEALVFPSKYEGFGLPILQAMAVVTPVICSKNKALQEVGGDVAIYVKYNDVSQLATEMAKITKKNERETRIEAGLSRIQKFSWNKTTERIYRLIEKIAKVS